METARRIETALAEANSLENPLDGLESFLTMELQPKQFSSCSPSSVIEDTEAVPITIQYYSSPLPDDLVQSCMTLFEENMSDLYRKSQWGLDLKEKEREFRREQAKFLIATSLEDGSLLGFAHFRFDVNDDDFPTQEVLYVYELQVSPKTHRCGLGRRLMSIMELVAMKTKMRKVMLTVFHANEAAMSFYLQKMKYAIDETSPSQYELSDAADYEILSKSVYRE